MALLLDLPSGVRRRLAEQWGAGEDTASLYRSMTEPESLRARVAALPPGARAALDVLRREAASPEELLARLPLSERRLDEGLAALTELGLALRAPEPGSRAPRLALGVSPRERLYVPADLAAALAAADVDG
jgi:DNA-binding transcriptional ArsR family regulator